MQRDRERLPVHRRSTPASFVLKLALFLFPVPAVIVAVACSTGTSGQPGAGNEKTGTVSQAVGTAPAYTATPPAPIATSGGATAYSISNDNIPGYPDCTSTSPLLAAQCGIDYKIAVNPYGSVTVALGADQSAMMVNPTYTTPATEPCSYYFSTGANAGVPQYTILYYNNGIPDLWHASCFPLYRLTTVTINCSTGFTDDTGACTTPPSNSPIVQAGASKPSDATIHGDSCPFGMCVPNATKLEAALQLNDIPVGYKPQKGPDVHIRFSYNHLDIAQPANPAYGNLGTGGRWTHNFNSYIQDDPAFDTFGTLTARYVAGGGQVNYPYETQGVVPGTYTFSPETQGGAVLSWTGSLYVLTNPDGSSQTFGLSDGAGSYPRKWFMTRVTDPQGNYVTISYDSSDRLTSLTDAESRVTNFCYDPTRSNCSTYSGTSTLISQITDPFGRSAVFSYDSYGRLSSIQDVIGITSSFTYDGTPASADAGAGDGGATGDPYFISQLTTPYGNSTFVGGVDYSQNMRWLELTDPDGYTERVEYDQTNSTIGATESSTPSGMTVENGSYNLNNTFYWSKYAYSLGYADGGTKDYTKATEITHWTLGNAGLPSPVPASSKKPNENRVYATYPGQNTSLPQFVGTYDQPAAIGRVLDDATSQVSTFTYNSVGMPTQAVDPLGRTTQTTYAGNGVDPVTVKQLTAPSTYTTIATNTFNSHHEVLTHVDAAGQTWRYCYNTAGQLTQAIDPANYSSGGACGSYGSVGTQYTYDGTGRVTTITDALGHTYESYTYSSTCGGGSHVNCDLPSGGKQPDGKTYTLAYDALDRITSRTDQAGLSDAYSYTNLDLTTYTDKLGHATGYTFDADRRLTKVTDPYSHTVQYAYYPDGVLETLEDQNSNVTTWSRDIEGRPTVKTFPDSTTETTTYESTTSRVKSVTDALSQIKAYVYDDANEVTNINYSNAGDGGVLSSTPDVAFTWDTYFPRRVQMVDGVGTTTWSYVAIGTNGALELLTDDGAYSNDAATYAYDADGRVNSATIGGTNAETWAYDAIGRVSYRDTNLGWINYTNYLHETSRPEYMTISSSPVVQGWTYGATGNDTLLTRIYTGGDTARNYSFSYSTVSGSAKNPYDLAENKEDVYGGSSHPWASTLHDTNYSYDNLDRLTGAACSSCSPALGWTYARDNAGSLTTLADPNGDGSGWTQGYNSLNEMTTGFTFDSDGERTADTPYTYKFDAEHRLIETKYASSSSKVDYIYDGLGRRVQAAFYNGSTTTNTRYQWCPPLPTPLPAAGGARICAKRDGSDNVLKRYYPEGEWTASGWVQWVYVTDQIGSVRDVVDTGGNFVGALDYSPYGQVLRSSGTLPDYQYAGLFTDPNMGFEFSATRFYDPWDGAWLSRDPIAEAGGINLFAYAAGNPISNIDPSGLSPDQECTAAQEDQKRINRENAIDGADWIVDMPFMLAGPAKGLLDGFASGPEALTVSSILDDPSMLAGQTLQDVQAALDGTPGWIAGPLTRGSQKGNGWVFRQTTVDGQPTGRMIQYHPGGGHHGPEPYWKVNAGDGPVRVGPQFQDSNQ